jgi:hypothetical protein
MTFSKTDEILSNLLHAAMAIAFGLPVLGIALHAARHLV